MSIERAKAACSLGSELNGNNVVLLSGVLATYRRDKAAIHALSEGLLELLPGITNVRDSLSSMERPLEIVSGNIETTREIPATLEGAQNPAASAARAAVSQLVDAYDRSTALGGCYYSAHNINSLLGSFADILLRLGKIDEELAEQATALNDLNDYSSHTSAVLRETAESSQF